VAEQKPAAGAAVDAARLVNEVDVLRGLGRKKTSC
jgi:hypothetical protein